MTTHKRSADDAELAPDEQDERRVRQKTSDTPEMPEPLETKTKTGLVDLQEGFRQFFDSLTKEQQATVKKHLLLAQEVHYWDCVRRHLLAGMETLKVEHPMPWILVLTLSVD